MNIKAKVADIIEKLVMLNTDVSILHYIQSINCEMDTMIILSKLLANYLGLKWISSGAVRAAFRYEDYIIKIPIGADEADKTQTQTEVELLRYANENNIPYAPPLIHEAEGIIVIPYYKYGIPYTDNGDKDYMKVKDAINELQRYFKIDDNSDVKYRSNWRMDKEGHLFLIDWGTVELKDKREVKSFR